jgi:hypothetical protein
MFNCSNCDSSKKLVNTKIQLLDAIQANVKKIDNWSKIKNHLPYVYFEQFHFLTKKYQLLKLQLVDFSFEKCQQLDTIYSKENCVHVRQLG